MNLRTNLSLLILLLSILFSACGGGGGGGTNPASSLFATKTVIEPGAICPNGGIQIDMGFDNNGNNILDPGEITKTEYICNGEDGADGTDGEDGADGSSHPFVVYTSPTPNENNVESDTLINAVFSAEMDGATINTTTFTVTDSSGVSVTGTVTYSGIVAVFQPSETLLIDKKYTVNLASTIENKSGKAMGYNHKIYFTVSDTVKVLYMANGATAGSVPVDSARYSAGSTATVLGNTGSLAKAGYVFAGWNTKADGSGTHLSAGGTVTVTDRSVVLYAMWSEPHHIIYNANGADGGSVPVDSNTYIYGEEVIVLGNTDNLEKDAYEFDGWNTKSDGTGVKYSAGAKLKMPASDITLYAMWRTPDVHYSGNPDGTYPVPADAQEEDITVPDHVVGNGTPESCTSKAFVDAVKLGGKITFNCGSNNKTIVLDETAKIFNNTGPEIIIDGAKKITLSGNGVRRILYMNTCDEAQVWTTDHCDNQDHPKLTVQNITFIDANSSSDDSDTVYGGGGAIWARGGRFKAVNCRFYNNVCVSSGADAGGGAIRVFSQYNNLPAYITNSTFGGTSGLGNSGSNGGAISSIGVSWSIYNSLFSYNSAIGEGGNPAREGTDGGGSGGAIYNDGNTMTLGLYGTKIEYNSVNEYGASIFFVSNNHTGNIIIDQSYIKNNLGGSWYPLYPSISCHSDTLITVTDSTIE